MIIKYIIKYKSLVGFIQKVQLDRFDWRSVSVISLSTSCTKYFDSTSSCGEVLSNLRRKRVESSSFANRSYSRRDEMIYTFKSSQSSICRGLSSILIPVRVRKRSCNLGGNGFACKSTNSRTGACLSLSTSTSAKLTRYI